MTPGSVVARLLVVVGWCSTTLAQSGVSPCVDRSPSCQVLAGSCKSNVARLVRQCPVSCGLCRPDPPPTITKPEFECGRGIAASNARNDPSNPRNRSQGTRNHPRNRFQGTRQDPRNRSQGTRNHPRNRSQGTGNDSSALRESSRRGRAASPQRSSGKVSTASGPEQVAELRVEDTFCGATPISSHFLLTAAYCVFDPDYPISIVRLGELDFSQSDETNARPRDYHIEQIIVHPDYKPDSPVRYNDIALLKTIEPISFNQVVYPFCVAPRRPSPGTSVIGSGFGLVNETHQSPVLQEVTLNVMASQECEKQYKDAGLLTRLTRAYPNLLQGNKVLCAGHPGRGACKGDEGGPLYLDDPQGRRYLVGIVSYTGGNCNKESIMPGVYTSVADHVDFIDSVLYGGV